MWNLHTFPETGKAIVPVTFQPASSADWTRFVWACIGVEEVSALTFARLSCTRMLDKTDCFRLYQTLEPMRLIGENETMREEFVEFLRACFRKDTGGMKAVGE